MKAITGGLTKKRVAELIASTANALAFDGHGLLLRRQGGAASYVLRYVLNGRRREIGLGPASIGLASARAEASRLRALAAAGQDPIEARKLARVQTLTVRGLFTRWCDSVAASKTAQTAATNLNSFRHLESIGDRAAQAVTGQDIARALGEFWATNHPTAKKVLQRLHAAFQWGHSIGEIGGVGWSNPAAAAKLILGVVDHKETPQPAVPFAAMSAFWSRLKAETETVADALRLLILSGGRRGEILGATWSEIDLDAALWTVPAERMKMRRTHRVPLPAAAVALLRGLQRGAGSDLVFPGAEPGAQLGNMAIANLMKRLDAKTATAHGFRSSFATWAEETGKADDITIDLAIAHVSGKSKTARAYARGDRLEARRVLMSQWADYLEGIETGDANVVPFQKRA
jgi:integrase